MHADITYTFAFFFVSQYPAALRAPSFNEPNSAWCAGHYGIVVGSRVRGRSRDARPGVSSLFPVLPVTCVVIQITSHPSHVGRPSGRISLTVNLTGFFG